MINPVRDRLTNLAREERQKGDGIDSLDRYISIVAPLREPPSVSLQGLHKTPGYGGKRGFVNYNLLSGLDGLMVKYYFDRRRMSGKNYDDEIRMYPRFRFDFSVKEEE